MKTHVQVLHKLFHIFGRVCSLGREENKRKSHFDINQASVVCDAAHRVTESSRG